MQEDLRKWFSKTDPGGDWKRINSKGEAIGPCAREPGEPKPKCMSRAKRESLTKKERASAVRAKRKHDPDPERKGSPINVSNFGKGKISEDMENLNEKNVPTSPEKWAQAKAQAKAKFDVYPSAYANGWAAKKYKEMGGSWKSVSEAKEVGDDPTGSSAQETLVKKGGKTTVAKPIAEASSVAVRMQRALDRIKAKREASEQRGREVLQPKKPEPVKEDVEQLDELSPNALGDYMKAGHKKYDSIRNNTDSASMAKKSKLETGIKKAAAKRYPAKPSTPEPKKDPNSRGYEQGRYMGDSVEHEESLIEDKMGDTGWQKSKSKTDTVTDKSGAVHTAQSKVRDLARRAMKAAGAKQANSVGAKSMKEATLVESRKTEIIKDAADSAKKKKSAPDKFEANPVLDSQVQKVDNT